MPSHATPDPSAPAPSNCAVEGCPIPASQVGHAYCPTHAAEQGVAELASFVQEQVERSDGGDVIAAIRATRALHETLIVLAAARGARVRG